MNSWKTINLYGAVRISKVVGEFQIYETRKVPYGKFRIKVLEECQGCFSAFPNAAYKNNEGQPEWTSGRGCTIEEALEDAIKYFMESLPNEQFCTDDKFEWAAPEDF